MIFLSALFTCVPQLHAPSIARRPDEAFFRGFSQDFTDISRQPPQTSRKKIVLTLLTSPKLWYNVLVTATANAELMKDRCPSESDCQGVAAGRALSVRTNVLITATANAELMKDRCPSESDCQGEAAGRALSVRTNVLVTATANAELMKRFRLYSFGSAARPESAKRAKRVI